MSDATPRPWTYRAKVLGAYWVLNGEGMTVALAESEKDAALIVRAVNAHEALVEALRILTDECQGVLGTCAPSAYTLRAAREALRAAEGDA